MEGFGVISQPKPSVPFRIDRDENWLRRSCVRSKVIHDLRDFGERSRTDIRAACEAEEHQKEFSTEFLRRADATFAVSKREGGREDRSCCLGVVRCGPPPHRRESEDRRRRGDPKDDLKRTKTHDQSRQ